MAKGTKGDEYFDYIVNKILKYGCRDERPRPYYKDIYEGATYDYTHHIITEANGNKIILAGEQSVITTDPFVELHTPAYTLSLNGELFKYNLAEGESPLITKRPIPVNNGIKEILWIYKEESNDLVEFDELIGKNTWDIDGKINNWWKDWPIRNPDGSYNLNEKGHPHIGHCYGATVLDHKLMKTLIDGIRKDPFGRRHIMCMWQVEDFNDPHGLKPCAFMTIWNVRKGRDGRYYLDMSLIQRSSDYMTAGSLNQIQYVALQTCLAKYLGYEVGEFNWFVQNIQIYDRHIAGAEEMLKREPIDCKPHIEVADKDFYDPTGDDIKVVDYPVEKIKKKNPQIKFPIAI